MVLLSRACHGHIHSLVVDTMTSGPGPAQNGLWGMSKKSFCETHLKQVHALSNQKVHASCKRFEAPVPEAGSPNFLREASAGSRGPQEMTRTSTAATTLRKGVLQFVEKRITSNYNKVTCFNYQPSQASFATCSQV